MCVLLPLGEQKGKRFAEKFAKEDPRTFWYKDERKIVSSELIRAMLLFLVVMGHLSVYVVLHHFLISHHTLAYTLHNMKYLTTCAHSDTHTCILRSYIINMYYTHSDTSTHMYFTLLLKYAHIHMPHTLTHSHTHTHTHTQELLPPPEYESSSSDSSEGEELPGFDEQFELGGADTYDNKDIYDLWDESPPEGKGRKQSTMKRSAECMH